MAIQEILGQQTFMGASIVNFNLQLKYGNNPSTLDLNLLVDKDNKVTPEGAPRTYNAAEEGYRATSLGPPPFGHAPFGLNATVPGGMGNLYHNTGDFFYTAELGSPVWFNYYRYDKDTITEVVTRRPVTPQHPWYFNGLLMSIGEDHSTDGGRLINARIEDPRRILAGVQVILSPNTRTNAPADGSYGIITDPINRKFKDGYVGTYNTLNVFGMIEEIQGYASADRNKSGLVWYDPAPGKMAFKNILEILQILLMGKPDPAKWEVHGNHTVAFPTFKEPAGFQPHPYWNKDYFTVGGERFGGPPYYVTNVTNTPDGPFNPAIGGFGTSPNNAYRYKVDLSELSLLTKGLHPLGILGTSHRINAATVSLLDLIGQVCKAANADFFVELLPDASPWPPNIPARIVPLYGEGVSGVIKIRVIHRVKPPVPGILSRHVEASKKDPFDLPNPLGIWSGRLASSRIGYEFGDVPVGSLLIGGPKTRVVGVTELGTDHIRGEYVSPLDPLDILREKTQFDGVRPPNSVTFAATNQFVGDKAIPAMPPATPVALPAGRKIALAIPHPNAAMQPIASETSDYRNDIWDVTGGGNNAPHEMNMMSPTEPGSNVRGSIPLGDNKIDLFPAWGFSDREDYCKLIQTEDPCNAVIGCSWDVPQLPARPNCKQTVNLNLKDQPAIGFFNSDEPLKDFNDPTDANIEERKAGLMYTVEWVEEDCDLDFIHFNLTGVRRPLPGGMYNELWCPAENLFKGGPSTPGAPTPVFPKPMWTRPRIRRSGKGCLNKNSVRMVPAVSENECICGECKTPGPTIVATGDLNRADCEAAGNIWTIGVWDASAGNCSAGNPTDNIWSAGGGKPVLPQTATIPIDMSEVINPITGNPIYDGGDDYSGALPNRKFIYKATVTELRAAAESKDSWISYVSHFGQRLMEHMGWSGQAELNSIFETMWHEAGTGPLGTTPDNDDPNDPGGTTATKKAEINRYMDTPTGFNYREPATPVARAGPTAAGIDIDAYSCGGPGAAAIDRVAGRARAWRADRGGFINDQFGQGAKIELFYNKIKEIATTWYGRKYLMPLPFDPEIVESHVREVTIKGAAPGAISSKPTFENDWDTASAGWVDIDMKAKDGKDGMLPYPQSFDFYDDSGKLEPFFVYPQVYADKDLKPVKIDHSEVPKGAKHKTLNSGRDYDITTEGKLFVKARIDPQTYWIWEPQAGIKINQDTNGNAVLDFASHGGSEEWFLEKVKEYGDVDSAAQDVFADGDHGHTPLRLKPYALLTVEGVVNHGPSDHKHGGILTAKKELLSILEFLFPDKATPPLSIDDNFMPGSDWIKARLAPAAFKPYEAAAPQRSNRESWGPWGGGISFGKVIVKKDDSLAPENAGSTTAMNEMAKSQVKSSLVSQQVSETGSVELVGPPEYFLGRPIVVLGPDVGPYITGITVDVNASAGITTTYTMRSWIPDLPAGPVPGAMGGGMNPAALDAAEKQQDQEVFNNGVIYDDLSPPDFSSFV